MNRFLLGILAIVSITSFLAVANPQVRVATFNVSMEATNYIGSSKAASGKELSQHLKSGEHNQIQNIAEIIQRVRPDIIVLNEFDYLETSAADIHAFINTYLLTPQNASQAIHYPYSFSAPVNTGVSSGIDLNNDGENSGIKGDAFGYGLFPGHYGMLVLSQYPIKIDQVRTYQHFLWKDMPNNLLNTIKNKEGRSYYSDKAAKILRLSSKSHWDIPIQINEQTIHVLASHPTPPAFDGPENRNGKRNHDEIRFWTDYISGNEQSAYIYDDQGQQGGFKGKHFVIAGDLNASPDEGDGNKAGIKTLLKHSLVNNSQAPASEGGKLHTPDNPHSAQHTAGWRMRADYVLPSASLKVKGSGVFWPKTDDPLFRLIKDRKSSSDHRLVWVDVLFPK